MTATEFVTWLKGFSAAASNYTLTPAQWDTVRDMLNEVSVTNEKATKYLLDGYNINTTAQVINDSNKIV